MPGMTGGIESVQLLGEGKFMIFVMKNLPKSSNAERNSFFGSRRSELLSRNESTIFIKEACSPHLLLQEVCLGVRNGFLEIGKKAVGIACWHPAEFVPIAALVSSSRRFPWLPMGSQIWCNAARDTTRPEYNRNIRGLSDMLDKFMWNQYIR